MIKKATINKVFLVNVSTLIVCMLGGCSLIGGKTARIQKNMAEYLEKTFEEEFVVEKPVLIYLQGIL